jgi:hypothetical protein
MRLIVAMLLLAAPVFAQSSQGGPPQGAPGGGGGNPPKNLKLLKPDEVRARMGAFRAGLGVGCDFCHVEGDRASDDNPKKVVARGMIAMTADINAKMFGNGERVTCYTCHRGKQEPDTAPPPAQ